MPSDPPLVSAVILTMDRRQWLPRAVKSFLSQTWPNTELVIVFDGEDILDLIPDGSNIVCIRGDGHRTLGDKRNLGCETAKGEFIFAMDDDDVSLSWRMAAQVDTLRRTNKSVTGCHSMRFTDGERWWAHYMTPQFGAHGASMCFRRNWWSSQRFPAITNGEDTDFITHARVRGDLITTDCNGMMFQQIHALNSSQYRPVGHDWEEMSKEKLYGK